MVITIPTMNKPIHKALKKKTYFINCIYPRKTIKLLLCERYILAVRDNTITKPGTQQHFIYINCIFCLRVTIRMTETQQLSTQEYEPALQFQQFVKTLNSYMYNVFLYVISNKYIFLFRIIDLKEINSITFCSKKLPPPVIKKVQ